MLFMGTNESTILRSSKPELQKSSKSSSGRRKLATSSGNSASDVPDGRLGGSGGMLIIEGIDAANTGSSMECIKDVSGDVSGLPAIGPGAHMGSKGS